MRRAENEYHGERVILLSFLMRRKIEPGLFNNLD